MKKFSKVVAAAMAATMVMSLGACGSDNGSTQAGKHNLLTQSPRI